jgi:hypothetical protein
MYLDELARLIGHRCDMNANDPVAMKLLRLYALLGAAKGLFVESVDVHDAWAIWRVETKPDHPSLVPFNELSSDVQALDDRYREAIRWSVKALRP